MPEHACRWNLAPGLDNALAWRRATTWGHRTNGDRIATLPGPWLKEDAERCTSCGGSGLVMVPDERDQEADGHEPHRLGRAE